MRGGKFVVVLAGIGLLAAGCATNAATTKQPSSVSLTAAVTQTSAQTAKVASTMSMRTQGMTVTFTTTGEFDFSHSRGTLAMQAPADMTELFMPSHLYLKISGSDSMPLPKGKSWIDIGTGNTGPTATDPIAGLAGPLAGPASPAGILAMLTAVSGSVRKLGTSTVRGVPVTEFQVNVDTAKAAARMPSADRGSFQAMMSAFGGGEIPVDVWVDNQNLVRQLRISLRVPASVPGAQGMGAPQGSVYIETTDFYDFGVEVRVTAPPASQVASMSQLSMAGVSSGSGGSGSGGLVPGSGSASPPPASGSLSQSQATAAEQAVSAFWSALGSNDRAALTKDVLPAQRSCVSSKLGSGFPKITVSGLKNVLAEAAGPGKATVRFTVSASITPGGATIPVLPDGSAGGQWLVAAESGGHWYVDIASNPNFMLSGAC
ncbi:MAG: hypothetical protein ACRDN0_37045 [Trebonia sp.]